MTATPSSSAPPDPLVGRILQDRYRIVRRIGEGGMGAVYQGEHLLIGNPVAVKVLHAKHASDPAIVERFRREAQATTRIRHHNIVGMFDLGQLEDGSLYLVMEHLDGRDWSADLEREGPQPIAKVVHILSQVCDALGAAHEAGIVHRDIKPDNIFLIRRSGDPSFVKVLDFGISKIREGASALAPSKTQTGTAMGTPYYMAPEQVQGRKDIDGRTDIYALGIVLFQALTGHYPFDGETYPMLVMSIVTQPIPQLAAYRPDLPAQVQHVLERMVAKDPAQRFGSVEEVKAALAPFAHVVDRPASAIASVPRAPLVTPIQSEVRAVSAPSPSSSRSGLLLVIVALTGMVLAGVVAGVVLALWPDADARPAAPPSVSERPRPDAPDAPTHGEPPARPATPATGAAPQPVVEAPREDPPSADVAVSDPPSADVRAPDLAADSRESPVNDARAPERDRPSKARQTRARRQTQNPGAPEARPLGPSSPVEPPGARSTRTGINDAPILR